MDSTANTPPVLLRGTTTASYFWDDGSSINGDTGAPASGKPMQKGLFASPSWPMGTEGYVYYGSKKAKFFVGDLGPGAPSNDGVMIDMDGKTFAELTGGSWNSSSREVEGFGDGHIKVTYEITQWGSGPGEKDHPVPFSEGAWKRIDTTPATPPPPKTPPAPKVAAAKPVQSAPAETKDAQTNDAQANDAQPKNAQAAAANLQNAAAVGAQSPITGYEAALPTGMLAVLLAGAFAINRFRARRRTEAVISGRHRKHASG